MKHDTRAYHEGYHCGYTVGCGCYEECYLHNLYEINSLEWEAFNSGYDDGCEDFENDGRL